METFTRTVMVYNPDTGQRDRIQVGVVVDTQKLAERLAAKAVRNKSKASAMLYGTVKARVLT